MSVVAGYLLYCQCLLHAVCVETGGSIMDMAHKSSPISSMSGCTHTHTHRRVAVGEGTGVRADMVCRATPWMHNTDRREKDK